MTIIDPAYVMLGQLMSNIPLFLTFDNVSYNLKFIYAFFKINLLELILD